MTTSQPRTAAAVPLLVTIAVMGAACSGGDDAAVTVTTAAATDAGASTPDPTPPATSSGTTAPASTDAGALDATTTTVALTATAPGVTADSIAIGYSYIDFEELEQLGFVDSGWGDQEVAFQAVVDHINAGGGILGRRLEVIFEPYSVLGTESAEAVCLRLTEDEEVFAVVGGFLGPPEAANTCIAGRGGTVLVGGVQSADRLENLTAPWLTAAPLRTRLTDILLTLLDSEGLLEGSEVAVVASVDALDVLDDVVTSMEAADAAPVEVLQSDAPIGDIVAEDTVWAALGERIRTAGADTVLLVGNPNAGIRNIDALGLDTSIWVIDQETLTALGNSVDLESARGILAAAPLTAQELWDHESTAVCRDAFASAHPELEIIAPGDMQEGDENWARGLTTGCMFLKLFEAVAVAAGPDLTNETFAAAAADLAQFAIPGHPFASLGPGKHDAGDSFALVSFNPDLGSLGGFDLLTELQDVTP